MYKATFLSCLLLVGYSVLTAQDLSGKIIDESAEALEYVIVHNGSAHTHTNENGQFTFGPISILSLIHI